jgi:hypothetical protein
MDPERERKNERRGYKLESTITTYRPIIYHVTNIFFGRYEILPRNMVMYWFGVNGYVMN